MSAMSQKIETEGAQVLAEALKALKPIPNFTTLDLENCKIRDNGAQALGDALKTNSTLATLALGAIRSETTEPRHSERQSR